MAAGAELSTVHRYAAGGIFALALSQAHIQQHSLAGFGFPPVIDPGDDHHASQPSSAEDELVSWSSEKCGLLRHIFRYLCIDDKAWVGLESTSISPDAKYHIAAFLKLLEEDDAESRNLRKDEVALAKAVNAMVQSIREKQIDDHTRGVVLHAKSLLFPTCGAYLEVVI